MDDALEIPRIANHLADPARAKILWTLIDGTTRPAGELAYAASISAQSASAHLAKLVEGGLLAAEVQGRHRYFRIASAEVAGVIESMASLSVSFRPRMPRAPLPSPAVPVQFLHARTCYGHLAGEMAVKVLEGMLQARWLTANGRDFAVTPLGGEKIDRTRRRSHRSSPAPPNIRPRLRGPHSAARASRRRARGCAPRTLCRARLDPAPPPLSRCQHHAQRPREFQMVFRYLS